MNTAETHETTQRIQALTEAQVHLAAAERALAEARTALGSALAYGASLSDQTLRASQDATQLLGEVSGAVKEARRETYRNIT